MTQKQFVLYYIRRRRCPSFTLTDIYRVADWLFPRPSLRRVMQELRQNGDIAFLDNRGTYYRR